jgi:hypothetical protein
MYGLQLIYLYRVIVFVEYRYLALSCKKVELATEGHGKTRKENAQAEERLDLRIREGDEGARGGK